MGNASANPRDRAQTLSEDGPIIGIPQRTDPATISDQGESVVVPAKVNNMAAILFRCNSLIVTTQYCVNIVKWSLLTSLILNAV